MLKIDHPKWTPEAGLNAAAEALVVNHMPLARKRARTYAARYSLDREELEGVAFLGLMEAAKGYDAKRGFTFATYALPWLRAKLNEHVLANIGPTKIGTRAAEKTVFFRLPWVKSRLGIYASGDLEPEQVRQVAVILGLSERQVVEGNTRRAPAISLDAPADPESGVTRADWFADQTSLPEQKIIEADNGDLRRFLLRRALETLTNRERVIVEGRHGDNEPIPLSTFADRFGISVERVRQIETKAVDKIKRHVRIASGITHRPRTRGERQIDDLTCSREENDNIMRRAIMGRFSFADPIPNEFDARVCVQIDRTRTCVGVEQAARRAWCERAVAAGLSWAVQR